MVNEAVKNAGYYEGDFDYHRKREHVMITWQCLSFAQLTTHQLYDALKLRADIFVVEQDCVYPDLDDNDRADDVYHLLGYQDGKLIAYLRLLNAGLTYDNVSIGRVVTAQETRGSGIGHQLLKQGLENAARIWPNATIEIGAQEHLIGFYSQYGFKQTSDMYLEDGIPHVDMVLTQGDN
ncbi:putative ElaA-like protein [Photobacterium angustum S14]|uniref:Protein ElaA n=2 Tax=Photobacterium angustum TaxID=661 RepID=Q1ZKH4_PHOAS|nr:putative ElaA-like protein [Photobacterium angustum S14]